MPSGPYFTKFEIAALKCISFLYLKYCIIELKDPKEDGQRGDKANIAKCLFWSLGDGHMGVKHTVL